MRFLRPDMADWWLIVPLACGFWFLRYRYRHTLWNRAAIARRFQRLSRRSTWKRDVATLTFGAVATMALAFSLMRPQVLLARRAPEFERQDLILIMDRSASMGARDIQPSRFVRATQEIKNFLRNKPETINRVGLVGFADAAVVLSYLTRDVDNVAFYLDWIVDDPQPWFGTNIGLALASALEVAQRDNQKTQKLFLLLSDGEDHGSELRKMLATFREKGLAVHCVGIGSDDEVPIPIREPQGQTFLRDDDGRLVRTRFSETTLREIASFTGGRYYRSVRGTELATVIREVALRERRIVGWTSSTDYRDLYRVGLMVAGVAALALLVVL